MDEKTQWIDQGKRQLFRYESEGRYKNEGDRTSWLRTIPGTPSLVDTYGPKLATKISTEQERRFQEWLKTKRDFTEDEVVKGSWIKISDDPKTPPREFRLHQHEHTLSETDLFKPQESTWYGTWQILSGVLVLIEKETYIFAILAAKDGLMHSGIDGDMRYLRYRSSEPYAYFKVLHLP